MICLRDSIRRWRLVNNEQLTDEGPLLLKDYYRNSGQKKLKHKWLKPFKNANVNTEEEITQSTDEKEESRSVESPQTVENPELDKIKIEFYKALKEFEGTDPNTRYQIPKQKCSRRLATIITAVNQEILPEYLKHNVTNFVELHDTIYAAAVATVRLSAARIDRKQLNHIQNKTKTPPQEKKTQDIN